mmetsp:Transcript_61562/g.105889  ORF Transcript_61562/g.105889 Transcript_61562/m.105889 type:complete len:84 (-) Transcript_61562:312-563(-)
MSLDVKATGGSERDPVRRVVLSAKEKCFLSTELQDNNTFEHSNEDCPLSLEQGWNHEAQLELFTSELGTSLAGVNIDFRGKLL